MYNLQQSDQICQELDWNTTTQKDIVIIYLLGLYSSICRFHKIMLEQKNIKFIVYIIMIFITHCYKRQCWLLPPILIERVQNMFTFSQKSKSSKK